MVLPLAGLFDLDAERANLEKQIAEAEAEVGRLEAKLGNEQFTARAPAAGRGEGAGAPRDRPHAASTASRESWRRWASIWRLLAAAKRPAAPPRLADAAGAGAGPPALFVVGGEEGGAPGIEACRKVRVE